jgi:anti-sigma factor RsiW
MSECARALGMMSEFVDGELGMERTAWFKGHLDACAECRVALSGFTKIDNELTAWGRRLSAQNPPPADAREQLAVRLASFPAQPRAIRWMPAAAVAAIAAALVLAVIPAHKQPLPAVHEAAAAFVEIPYLPPLDPREYSTIVRMNIRVATLIAAGYRIAADPDTIVPADVLVGEDGRAHAVRVLSGIEWKGTGD